MSANKKTDSDDDALFRRAVADVSPLAPTDRHHSRKTSRPPKPVKTEADNAEVMTQLPDPSPQWLDDSDTGSGEELSYRFDGVQLATLRKLRRGQYRMDAQLDLHGHTINAARQALADFLVECRSHGWRSVRIIHGKGKGSGKRGPVIKSHVDYWLRLRHEVIAFCSAPPSDGGTGAVYVLLRKPAKPSTG